MPHYFSNVLVVTEAELVPEFYSTMEVLWATASRDKRRGFGLRKVQGGGNGRQLLVEFDSLPSATQDAIGDPRKGLHPMEPFYRVDHEAVEFFQKTENGYTTDEHMQKQVVNASVLQAAAKLKEAHEATMIRMGKKPMKVMQMVAAETKTFNPVLKAKWGVEHSLPEEYRNLEKRMQRFAEERYHSLIHGLTGKKNAAKRDDYTDTILMAMFGGCSTKPTYQDVVSRWNGFVDGYVDVVNTDTGELYSHAGCKKLARTTIYNYLAAWESRIGAYKQRSGDRQVLMQQFKPHHSLVQPEWAGSIISIDDRQPPFEFAPGRRVWFYNGIDLGSECFTTWVWGQTKEGLILDFYRQMARNYHRWGFAIPAELECESSLNKPLSEGLLKEGNMFQTVRIEANNARGKRIEQYYRQLRYKMEKDDEAWIARPFAISESNRAGSKPPKQLPYEVIVEKSLGVIERWNNMPHSRYPDKTRWEVFCEKQNPQLRPTNWRGILPHIGFKTTSSCHAGIFRFRGTEFIIGHDGMVATGDAQIGAMKAIEGKEVDIYWLDDDEGNVMKAIVYIGDSYYCEAILKPRYNRATIEQTAKDAEARELMSRYVATVEGFQQKVSKAIVKVEVIDNRPKTLNDKFQIGIKKATPETEWKEPEVLDEPGDEDEYELIPVETTFKQTMYDRF